MIDPRYESRIRNGEPLEKVVEDRTDADGETLIDAINVWAETTDLIQANDPSKAIEYLERTMPDCLDDEVRLLLESEGQRRKRFEPPRETLEIGSYFGPTLNDGRGRYRIDALIAEGSQGSVYKAIDRKFRAAKRSQVAIKIHKNTHAIQGVRVQSIDHPNVVRVHDHDIDHHGRPTAYIVFEFLEGMTLDEWAAVNSPTSREIIEILMQICAGVQAIHTLPIVHRDLKPKNIIMVSGRPVIADFGIAVDAFEDQSVAGSALTMAPEQLGHDADSTLVDIYGIGSIAFFLFTGTYPNGSNEADALLHLESIAEIDCDAIPGRPRAIIQKCLARSPMDRYQSAGEVRCAFQDVIEHRPLPTERKLPTRRLTLLLRRNPWSCAAFVVLASVLITTLVNQRSEVRQNQRLRLQIEELKATFQQMILDARLRDGELSPAVYMAIIDLAERYPEWDVWSYAALTTMEGELMLRQAVEDVTRDPAVSLIEAGYCWWLLARVQRAAGLPGEVSDASFIQARNLLVSKLGQDDPLIAQLDRDAARESSSP